MAAAGLPTTVLQQTWCPRRADGAAAILGIGTANPTNCVRQDEFADWYFRIYKSQHLTALKAKTKRICEKSGINKRHLHHIEEMIDAHPEILDRDLPSLGTRLSLTADAVPDLAAAAARKAIAEWGRPAADITHLVVSSNSGAHSPGPDLRLARILGLNPAVQRTMLYLHGCSGGAAAIRVAKDLAENNHGARVLVACVETFLTAFRAPDDDGDLISDLLSITLFGDGAGAVIVCAGPMLMMSPTERPVFHIVSSSLTTVPGTERAVGIQMSETGLDIDVTASTVA
ncbi:hypothetical protein PR202_gb13297 [Eleusine coracana subsp. coracana]|uniref:Chalcone/stilbene synthase N-terminal domain-containing protein n=1 Tax=Eleusine coracana subsp. coracana TaxID=191504 RepID=A0AAV5EQ08_ELECO|nr:hypothetical protein QOZ80_9BG0712980 [Eleusine coracana subsp. coracana]GJN25468.1 hypothetical protein PR202_gb13297 [Eleusine coracana subsp. coracana]